MNLHLRKTENLHILLWLIKDTFWVLDLKLPGMLMIIPTLSVAIYITAASKAEYADFMHNLAICFWISANAVWMTGEFYFNDSLRPAAIVFFVLGLLAVALFYMRRKFHQKSDK